MKVPKILDTDCRILVAVSGGVDSVYMLHALTDCWYNNIGIAHFNHMIRGDANQDVELVEKLAKKYNKPFHYMEYNIPQMAAQKKQSIELTAREARRHFFSTIMAMNEYEWLALGHHADDQAETVLYNLLRGSGVHGLAGMKFIDEEQKIFRPMLYKTKAEIYEAAHAFRLEWNEDYTNRETENDRSWLRNDIIPELETRRSGVKKVLTNTALRFQELSDYLKAEAKRHIENWEVVDVKKFVGLPQALQVEILGMLWEHHHGTRANFGEKVTSEVLRWLSGNPKSDSYIFFGKNKRLTYCHGYIHIEVD